MEDRLPSNAEAYLNALARELWPLASDERDSVLLELRGHLLDRAAAGALEPALSALGPPKALAQSFDLGGSRSAASIMPPKPSGYDHPSKRLSEIVGDVRATFLACRNGLFIVGALLVTVLTSTTYLSWMSIRLPTVGISLAAVMGVRLVVVLAALNAAYRLALSRDAPPLVDRSWRPRLLRGAARRLAAQHGRRRRPRDRRQIRGRQPEP